MLNSIEPLAFCPKVQVLVVYSVPSGLIPEPKLATATGVGVVRSRKYVKNYNRQQVLLLQLIQKILCFQLGRAMTLFSMFLRTVQGSSETSRMVE